MFNLYDTTALKFHGKMLIDRDGHLTEFNFSDWLNNHNLEIQDGKAGLKVRLLASASGVIINNRVYPGKEWERAAPQFAGKPVLKHHDIRQDAIGRIVKGEYKKKMDGAAFSRDYERPAFQGSGQESGLVYVTADITDPDAIQKIKDGRLLHVSQGSKAMGMICSHCGNDWAHGRCEHIPGTRMSVDPDDGADERFVYLIADGLMPKEISFVNEPAFGVARAIETDSEEDPLLEEWLGRINDSIAEPTVLGTTVAGFSLFDNEGHELDIRVVEEKNYQILTLPDNLEDEHSDTQTSGTKPDAQSYDSQEDEMSEKELKAELDSVKKLNDELTKSNEDLRKTLGEAERKLEDREGTLDALQKEFDLLTLQVTNDLIEEYLEVTEVKDEEKEAKRSELSIYDTGTLRFMNTEIRRMKELNSGKVTTMVTPTESLTDGDIGETGASGEEPAKPNKVNKKPRSKFAKRK